jgi:histidine triad (HIT) family protein
MALTQQQIIELKNQLLSQVQHLPPEQKAEAEQQIQDLSPEALEMMLSQEREKNKGPKKTIFRSIVDNDVPSIVVEENKIAKAVMDITPISKGHVLIIPIKPVSDAKQLPVGAFSLAKKIALRISKKLNSKSNLIQTENKFNESVIHVIPSYTEKVLDLTSERNKSKNEDLESISSLIRAPTKKPKVEKIKVSKPVQPTNAVQIKRRIP